MAGGDEGEVIVPGKADESRLYRYVAGLDPEHPMPPKKADVTRPSADEIARIRSWIDQGAAWPDDADAGSARSDHWAFRAPVRPDVPAVGDVRWPRNPIDRFVMARLEKEGLTPSPEADRTTLIRRLSLDLIGLPPTIAEVDAFLADDRPDAYERLVDRLLASPHHGEKWARRWLDKARYADTNGYEKDRERSIWAYRDWVIKAINDDKPFSDFTIEQIAGDLLPDPSPEQKIATGFHRNTMRNEEGGIDVEEFRYAALVDRVSTTGATWLGLTIQCAQCHTHKYDPITQREYYQFLAFFNNTDEPEEFDVPDESIAARRREIASEVARLESGLADRFPAEDPKDRWQTPTPLKAESSGDIVLKIGTDNVIVASGPSPDTATYTIDLPLEGDDVESIRLDAVADPKAEHFGPGRTRHGNFVVTNFSASLVPPSPGPEPRPIAFKAASADAEQPGFAAEKAIDGDARTGWAIDDGSGRLDRTRSAEFAVGSWSRHEGGATLRVRIDQQYGGQHTLGRFRISIRRKAKDDGSEADRRLARLAAKQSEWEATLKPARWTIATPSRVVSRKNATMTVLPDGSVLASGDKPNNDLYDLQWTASPGRITAIRLEALTDPSLPENGPGRAPLYSVGDFILTEMTLSVASDDPSSSRPIALANASQDFAPAGHTAAEAIDGVPESGWTIQGATGKPHAAVFELSEPLEVGPRGLTLSLTLHQFGIHQTTLGRFRVSTTGDATPVKASGLPSEVEAATLVPKAERSPAQEDLIRRQFLAITPELAGDRAKIESLRRSMPRFTTTLVLQERDRPHTRTTHIHRRGEYANLTEAVSPGVPSVLPPMAGTSSPPTRLDLARWLVSPENPLTARVAMNDLWQAFFGRGLVATSEDFGTRGDPPSHPELLDWMAVEFPARGWREKAMHRLIVTSATYRQSSKATPEQVSRDPKNLLLGRGSRFRVEAETVRDIALSASGLLNSKVGGPSVYPPQPDGVMSLSYGQQAWPTSSGADRYRRGLYTFAKRASPYAAFSLMDAPSPEVACVRRERSNTPLQALTLLNDPVFVECARAMADRAMKEGGTSDEEKARFLFRSCLAREPASDESRMLVDYHARQLARFRSGEADAAKVVGKSKDDDRAAWTLVARAVMNLDETITRE